jgi:hypothetical protein
LEAVDEVEAWTLLEKIVVDHVVPICFMAFEVGEWLQVRTTAQQLLYAHELPVHLRLSLHYTAPVGSDAASSTVLHFAFQRESAMAQRGQDPGLGLRHAPLHRSRLVVERKHSRKPFSQVISEFVVPALEMEWPTMLPLVLGLVGIIVVILATVFPIVSIHRLTSVRLIVRAVLSTQVVQRRRHLRFCKEDDPTVGPLLLSTVCFFFVCSWWLTGRHCWVVPGLCPWSAACG